LQRPGRNNIIRAKSRAGAARQQLLGVAARAAHVRQPLGQVVDVHDALHARARVGLGADDAERAGVAQLGGQLVQIGSGGRSAMHGIIAFVGVASSQRHTHLCLSSKAIAGVAERRTIAYASIHQLVNASKTTMGRPS